MIIPSPFHIDQIFTSPQHAFYGHHGMPPGTSPLISQSSVTCLAGRGILGDRFSDFKPDYKGQITFFAREVYEDLCQMFSITHLGPEIFRRNVITIGVDLPSLYEQEFEIQGIRFFGTQECAPCHWMNTAFHPGAELQMKGRGGLRARILTDGILRVTTTPRHHKIAAHPATSPPVTDTPRLI
ncbi:MAG: MOSC domain-containing protein [Verrucomicrobiota bacterium]